MVTYCERTPEWVKNWVEWACLLLIPDWTVTVIVQDTLEDGDVDQEFHPDRGAQIESLVTNLEAKLELRADVKNDHEGHTILVHEIVHCFLARMSHAAERLVTNKMVRRVGWRHFDDAEEETVVRLSRILVALRESTSTVARELPVVLAKDEPGN